MKKHQCGENYLKLHKLSLGRTFFEVYFEFLVLTTLTGMSLTHCYRVGLVSFDLTFRQLSSIRIHSRLYY